MYGDSESDQTSDKEAASQRVKRDEEDVRKLKSWCLLACKRKGQEHMTEFIEEWLNTNEFSFWDPIPKLKVKTLSSMTKKVTVKASDDKIATVSAERDRFGTLLIVANARQINVMEVMTYEFFTHSMCTRPPWWHSPKERQVPIS